LPGANAPKAKPPNPGKRVASVSSDLRHMEKNPAGPYGLVGAVLAAGFGRRFGRSKLDLPAVGHALIHWPVQAALDAGLDKVMVVTGPSSDLDRLVPADSRLEMLRNPRPEGGMGTSLALAARRSQELGAEVLVVLLGDMPLVRTETVRQVARAALLSPAGAAAAWAAERQAHPVAFAQRHLDRLGQLQGDVGGRGLLEELQGRLAMVEAPALSLWDVDTPEDLARVRKILERPPS
jgi:CTP:molybdopterin cytidylyltransferase MocA